jgi:hypothetical protein
MSQRFLGSISSIALAVAFLVGSALGQQLATLKLTVNDSTGAIVPGASVVLKNTETGAKRTAVADANGLAVIAGVPAGSYELTAEAKTFSPRTVAVQLSVGQVATLTLTMGIEVRQEVEVRETAQGIDLEKADVSQVIETRKIADLPISGRDFIDFVLLTPSVAVGRSTAVGAQSPFTETVLKLSFGGTRESHTSFFALDGVDYTTSISGVQRVSPSQDWVQEFRVVESPYNADTGRSLGSVVNTITKSGTNELHGSLYEFFRNDALNADNLLSAPGFTALRFNQFGATLGGPLRKEKNFIFLGYEGQRRAESPIYSSFILGTINPNPAICPVLPPPGTFNPACLSINGTKQFFGLQPETLGSVLSVDSFDKFIVKNNNVLSDRSVLNIAYLFNDTRKDSVRGAPPGEGLPSSYRDNPVRDQTVYANLVHVFSPHLTSDTLLQFGRRTFDLIPKGAGFEPAISIPNLLSGGGFVGSVRFYREQRVQLAENVTYTRGKHTLKFGGEAQPVWTNAQVPLFTPGFGVFCPDGFFGVPISGCRPAVTQPIEEVFLFLEPREFFGQPIPARTPPFFDGLFSGPAAPIFDASTRFSYVHKLYSLYVQDQWRVRPNLSLTFGVRYDVDVLPSGPDTKTIGPFHPTDYNNFQPRAAFAYSFRDGKDVLRGGFGLFTAPFVYSDILVSWIGASEFTYMFSSNVGPFGPPLLPEFSDPTNTLIGFGASGAVGLPSGIFPGPSAFFSFASTGAYPTPIGPFPLQFPLGYAKKDFPHAYSEMASLELEHELGRNWFFSAGYQYIHALKLPVYDSVNGLPNQRDALGVPLPCPPVGAQVPTPVGKDTFCPADPNFGFTLYVHPVAFSIYHAGTASLRKTFANHYSILANYTYSKSIDISTTVNLPSVPESYLRRDLDRAIGDNDIRHRLTLAVLGESPKEWPRVLRHFKASMLMNAQSARFFSINAGFDTNGDLFPFSDRVGTIGRNTYKGDPYFNLDMRIQRGIPFTERVRGDFSVEFFNLFNVVNVQDVSHVYGAPDFVFGPIPQEFGDGITTPAGFGTPKFAAPARQIQLSFRLNF